MKDCYYLCLILKPSVCLVAVVFIDFPCPISWHLFSQLYCPFFVLLKILSSHCFSLKLLLVCFFVVFRPITYFHWTKKNGYEWTSSPGSKWILNWTDSLITGESVTYLSNEFFYLSVWSLKIKHPFHCSPNFQSPPSLQKKTVTHSVT